MFLLYFGSFSTVQNFSCYFKMEAFTEMFLHNVFLHDALAPYKMSFFIPDVFSPLDDPTFNDILNHDNLEPGEDPLQLSMNDTDFLLAHDRVITSLAAFRHRVHESNPMPLQHIEQFGPRFFVTGINLNPGRVADLASVNLCWFHACLSGFRTFQFLAFYRMIQLSTRWKIPASVWTLDADQQKLLYEFSGRLCRQLRLTHLVNPLDRTL